MTTNSYFKKRQLRGGPLGSALGLGACRRAANWWPWLNKLSAQACPAIKTHTSALPRRTSGIPVGHGSKISHNPLLNFHRAARYCRRSLFQQRHARAFQNRSDPALAPATKPGALRCINDATKRPNSAEFTQDGQRRRFSRSSNGQ